MYARESIALHVAEISGVAGSGKDTLVTNIVDSREGVTNIESAADFRVLTHQLLRDGVVEAGMPDEVAVQRVAAVDPRVFVDTLARRQELVAETGIKGLRFPSIEAMVPSVASLPVLQNAVRAGLRSQIEAIRDQGEHRLLLVTSENLLPVVAEVDETNLCLRAFVKCNSVEAAWRKTEAAGLSIAEPAGEAFFAASLAALRSRNKRDGARPISPVHPDGPANTYGYWIEDWHVSDTVGLLQQRGANIEALGLSTQAQPGYSGNGLEKFFYSPDSHAAVVAGRAGLQLVFDTAPFRQVGETGQGSVDAMNTAALEMFDHFTASVLQLDPVH